MESEFETIQFRKAAYILVLKARNCVSLGVSKQQRTP